MGITVGSTNWKNRKRLCTMGRTPERALSTAAARTLAAGVSLLWSSVSVGPGGLMGARTPLGNRTELTNYYMRVTRSQMF